MHSRTTSFMLNVAHALDHMFLLIFATAVSAIAAEFGLARWEDLMPFGAAAFVMFGLGSLPAGKLGDSWGRRAMMLVFFFGLGAASILVALTRTPLQLAAALALLGSFAAIYHPVGIPMLVQGAARPGWTIGVNGFAGNLGVALAAVITGFIVKYLGWRLAFVIPGIACLACGLVFMLSAKVEALPPARRKATQVELPAALLARVFLIMTLAATSASLLFNFSTNGNYELLAERLAATTRDPAVLGMLLAVVYAIASVAQLAVGSMIDRMALKRLYLGVVALQVPALLLAAHAQGWWLYLCQVAFMLAIFGAIPFTDAMIVRYVDDRMRSRVAGMRLTVSIGASSVAVWALGPIVKAAGFDVLLLTMAGIATVTFLVMTFLPETSIEAAKAAPAAAE
jgi:MFS family permease